MSARRCSACGAAVQVPEGKRGMTCSFCDSALVDDVAQEVAPVDRVVPFSVPRERAAALLKAFLAGQWLAPESVRRAADPSALDDVLVPFWVYDAVARTSFTARVGIHWYRTETYTVTVNGKTETRTRQVQETEWFPLEGSHVRQWFDHLVSASRGLAEAEANALEPYDLGASLPYAPALVSGVSAEQPTIERDAAANVARLELAELERKVIASSHLPGDRSADLRTHTSSELEPPRLVLLPVWIAAVQTEQGTLRLLVNGQTGEVVGQVPQSWWKIGGVAAGVLLVVLSAVLCFGVLR
ncbi:MAG: hypothetical protein KC621_28175 [Myxococcales bacterium]|nr:hypothetical protein [Myxococcales bacterium]